MSDSEDRDILNEIRALENALASQPASRENNLADCSSALVPCASETDEVPLPDSSTTETTPRAIFNLNKKLLEHLYVTRDELGVLLDECDQKLALIDERLEQHTKSAVRSKVKITTAGTPYFKDKNHFAAGPNEDTKLKTLRNELHVVSLRKVCRWTPKDRAILMETIRQEAFSSAIAAFPDIRSVDGSSDKVVNGTVHQSANTCTRVSNDLKDTVGPLGAREFDWLKIAALDFDGKHSADECRVMWNVFLHPDINKGKWSKSEDLRLKKIAEQYKFQDWDSVASKLNTHRSGYQCFIRYNTIRSIKDFAGQPWTAEECKRLSKVVNQLRLGNYIPWGEVAECLFPKTKQQIYFRWKYSSAPHLKKGRFTAEEDKVLLNAVKKYGANFSKIAVTLLPHRSTIQLNDHYQTLVSRRKNSSVWAVNDDLMLLELYNELGPDWSQIAKRLIDKNRTQVRHRYTALNKLMKKGISVASIPRRKKIDGCSAQEVDSDETICNEVDENDIDELLIQHFCCLKLPTNSYEGDIFYNSSELKNITQRLYEVLQYLGANLNIPNNINDASLSETEKQILRSLKKYSTLRNDKARRRNTIETVRLKMFGLQNDDTKRARFIPSYLSELQAREDVMTEKIDCELRMDTSFIIEMSKGFETPEIVAMFIDDNEELSCFEKICNLLLFHSCNSTVEKPQINPALVSNAREKQGNNSNGYDKSHTPNELVAAVIPTLNLNTLQEKELKFMQHCEKVVAISRSCVDVDKPFSNIHFEICSGIEPDIATLMAFKNLFALKQLFDIEVVTNPIATKNPTQCQKVNDLLKKRLIQLFKYPVVMSHTFVPQVYMQNIFLDDTDVTSRKRKIVRRANVRCKKLKVIEEK